MPGVCAGAYLACVNQAQCYVYSSTRVRWCLHDTGMNERLAWFVTRLHGRSHSGMKML